MRVFVAGASGAIGRRLVPLLITAGHEVSATTRTARKAEMLRAAGATPVVLDALDRDAVIRAVTSARPDVVVHQMTALASMRSLKKLDREFALTNRLRTEATRHLIDAAREAGARTFVAQSYTGWPNERRGGRVKSETDPLDVDPPASMRATLDAIRTLESIVTSSSGLTGIVLRFGSFYGPGTAFSRDGEMTRMVRRGRFPIVGGGTGVWSFVHVDDAAAATLAAVERPVGGIYNIVDDEPAEVSVWLAELCRILGCRPPRRMPAWIARLAIGDAGLVMMTEARGSSNEKAKRVLGWIPRWASWREGFRAAMA